MIKAEEQACEDGDICGFSDVATSPGVPVVIRKLDGGGWIFLSSLQHASVNPVIVVSDLRPPEL